MAAGGRWQHSGWAVEDAGPYGLTEAPLRSPYKKPGRTAIRRPAGLFLHCTII